MARLLPLRLVEGIGTWLGMAAWACDLRHRRVALRNLARVFDRSIDDPWVRRTARASFASAGRSMASAAWLMGQSEGRVREHLAMEGGEHVREALDQGRGVIAAVAHVGPWEALAAVPLILEGIPCATMARPIRNRGVDRVVQRLRRRFGIEVFGIPQGYRASARFLKRRGVLGILVDQYAGSSGRWVPFMGVPASTTRAHASLARATGAVVLPTSVRRRGRAGFAIRMEAPVAVDAAGESAFLAEVNERLVGGVASSPEDWFWMHNRWRLPRRFLAGDPDSEARPRILVCGANWLGDAVMSLPAIRRIREMSPRAHIALLGPPGQQALFSAVAAIDEFIPRPGGGIWRTARRIRRGGFDAAFLLPNSLRSGLEMFFSGVPRRIGYGGRGRRALLTDIVPGNPRERRHQVRRYLDIIGAAGAGTALAAPRLDPSGEDRERARSVLGERGRGVIGLHAGAQYGPAKRWPADRFAAVAATFTRRGYKVVLFGGKDEVELAADIASRAGGDGILNLAGRTGLDELAALLACCDVVVANDTGPMHLAAAVGARVVALFGSTDPEVSAPLGYVRVVRERVPCSPCFRRTCPIDFPCMMGIDADRVAAEVELFLDAAAREAQGGGGRVNPGQETACPDSVRDRPRVSVLVTTGNEQERIRDCLESVRWADEIVVIDSCSTDRTAEIARGYTDRVLIMPWRGYIGQKQYALTKATHPWVLFVDADERVTPGLQREILDELARQPVRWAGFEMRRKVRYLGRWMLHGDWYPDHKLRLFLREKGKVAGEEPHDRVIVFGPIKRLRGELLHFTYRDLSDHLRTVNRFSTISAERMVRAGYRCGVLSMIVRPAFRFARSYVFRGGFLDGVPGLVGAIIVAFGVFVKYAKVRELNMASARPKRGEDPGAAAS